MVNTVLEPRALVGWELSGVAFVRDYVELHFDGPVLRCYAAPVVIDGGRRAQFPGPGSCDALRDLIGSTLREVQLSDDGLVVVFDDDRKIGLDFRSEWEQGREALEFMPLVDGRVEPGEKLVW